MRDNSHLKVQVYYVLSDPLWLDFTVLLLASFLPMGCIIPFWALWFEDQGVSAGDIGLLMGIAFGARCVANLVLTPRLHKVRVSASRDSLA